ncbi:MAG TPA: hypothetical protein VLM38_12600 [Blastocatellia bacterium]|nr:hypothetical protein [Blastocatellia bacterium]
MARIPARALPDLASGGSRVNAKRAGHAGPARLLPGSAGVPPACMLAQGALAGRGLEDHSHEMNPDSKPTIVLILTFVFDLPLFRLTGARSMVAREAGEA